MILCIKFGLTGLTSNAFTMPVSSLPVNSCPQEKKTLLMDSVPTRPMSNPHSNANCEKPNLYSPLVLTLRRRPAAPSTGSPTADSPLPLHAPHSFIPKQG